jgi:hypothetical protein
VLLLLLLLLLLRELECVVVGDLTLHLSEGLVGKLLLGLDHAQVHILLMGCGNLLLLLLKEFNLLGEGELLHHQGGELRRATSVCDVEATTARAGRAVLSMLIHCRWIETVVRRRGKMAEGCQTTVVGWMTEA